MSSNNNRQIAGRRSQAVGEMFEGIIDAACRYYKDKGMAIVEKTPEPMPDEETLKRFTRDDKNAETDRRYRREREIRPDSE